MEEEEGTHKSDSAAAIEFEIGFRLDSTPLSREGAPGPWELLLTAVLLLL